MPLTEQQKQEFLKEALDTRKVILHCGTHQYYGPDKNGKHIKKPAKNCKDCWMVFYFYDLANSPPDQRERRLEELTEVLRNVVQSVEQGTWDFKPFEKAKIEVTKDYDA